MRHREIWKYTNTPLKSNKVKAQIAVADVTLDLITLQNVQYQVIELTPKGI
jgi:hypothetical protein